MKKITEQVAADDGAAMAEYGLLATGIAMVAAFAVFGLGGRVDDMFDAIVTTVTAAFS